MLPKYTLNYVRLRLLSSVNPYNKRENKITLDRSDSGLLPTNVEGTDA